MAHNNLIAVREPEENVIVVWDVTTGSSLRRIEYPDPESQDDNRSSSMAFNPGGTALVCGSSSWKSIQIWDLSTGPTSNDQVITGLSDLNVCQNPV